MVAFYFSLTPIPKAERVAIFQKSLSTTCPVNSGDFCKRNLNVLNLGSRLSRVYIFPIGTRGDTCEILSDVGGKPELLWVFLLYLFANGTKHCRDSRDFTLFDKTRSLRLCLRGKKRST